MSKHMIWGRQFDIDPEEAKAERDHLERSLAERFNFFLLWVAIVTAAAYAVDYDEEPLSRLTILALGLAVTALTWWMLWRTFAKLVFTLAIMRAACPKHAGRHNHDSPMLPWRPSKVCKNRQDIAFSEPVAPPPLPKLACGAMFAMAFWIPLACTVGLIALTLLQAVR